jgi:hypothetical protein
MIQLTKEQETALFAQMLNRTEAKVAEELGPQKVALDEDDVSDLLWLVKEYGHYLEQVAYDDNHRTLQTKLEKMLDQFG